ncbi:2491_t:CDS:2, partial [Racocetra persica]
GELDLGAFTYSYSGRFAPDDLYYVEKWKERFNHEEVKQLIAVGFQKNIKSNDEKYNEYSVEVIANFKLDIEVIIPLKKIEREKRSRSDRYLEEKSYYNNNDITENKINVVSIVDKLIPDPDLKE